MRCEFSETQFVFGITNELINVYLNPKYAWGAPIFPTQVQEKKLGYDTTIKGKVITLFFQFKVPKKLTRSNSSYWRLHNNKEYFEFEIWPHNLTEQHNKLIDLANKDPHNKVYYCSPGFIKQNEFQNHYNNRDISKNSIYVPCKYLSKNAGYDKHSISYTIIPQKKYYYHSEPKEIEVSCDFEYLIKDIKESKPYENIEQCLMNVSEIFSVNIGNYKTDLEKFNAISNELLKRENLNILLFSL